MRLTVYWSADGIADDEAKLSWAIICSDSQDTVLCWSHHSHQVLDVLDIVLGKLFLIKKQNKCEKY